MFKKEAQKWLDYFGMKDWSIYYAQEKLDGIRAQCSFNCVGGVATLILNTSWDEKDDSFVTNKIVKRTAFHEVCELLLGRLNNMASQRFNLDEMSVEEEIHRIIRILENSVWEQK